MIVYPCHRNRILGFERWRTIDETFYRWVFRLMGIMPRPAKRRIHPVTRVRLILLRTTVHSVSPELGTTHLYAPFIPQTLVARLPRLAEALFCARVGKGFPFRHVMGYLCNR